MGKAKDGIAWAAQWQSPAPIREVSLRLGGHCRVMTRAGNVERGDGKARLSGVMLRLGEA